MVLVTIIILVILIFIFLVNFVVANIEMFQTSFDIVISFPFLENWSVTLEGVTFIYIVGASVLLGALVIAIGTWVLDTKRKIKFYRMSKELKRLQQEIQEARASLPPEEEEQPLSDSQGAGSGERKDSSNVTPKDVTTSFEHAVEEKGMLAGQDELSGKDEENIPQEPPLKPEEPLTRGDSDSDTERQKAYASAEQANGAKIVLANEDELPDAEKSLVGESLRGAEVSEEPLEATVEKGQPDTPQTHVEAEVVKKQDTEEEDEKEADKKPRQQKESSNQTM